jgi:plastocyanin
MIPMSRQGISTMIIVGIVVVLLVVVGVGYYVLMPGASGTTTTSSSSSTSSPSTSISGPAVVCASGNVTGATLVTIQDFMFSPRNVSISVGQTVQWTYDSHGQFNHTVTSDTGLFGSVKLKPGQSFSCTFKVAGTYGYHCMVHPTVMKNNFVKVT